MKKILIAIDIDEGGRFGATHQIGENMSQRWNVGVSLDCHTIKTGKNHRDETLQIESIAVNPFGPEGEIKLILSDSFVKFLKAVL